MTEQTKEAMLEQLRQQVEYYFSKDNLLKDQFLVSHMSSNELFVPIAIIAQFSKVEEITSGFGDAAELIRTAVADSKSVTLSSTGTQIRPNVKTERDTLILREIPAKTPSSDIEKMFQQFKCAKPEEIRSDVGDIWFVRMPNEKAASDAFDLLRGQSYNGKPIKVRIKSENPLSKLLGDAARTAAAGPPMKMDNLYTRVAYGGGLDQATTGSAFVPAMSSFYDMQASMNLAQNMSIPANLTNRTDNNRERVNSISSQHSTGVKSNWSQPKRERRDSIRSTGSFGGASVSSASTFGWGDMMLANDGATEPLAPAGYQSEFSKYTHDQILNIVRKMSIDSIKRPETMQHSKHPSAVVEKVNSDLLHKQRTGSMDHASKNGRQRFDSVGSVNSIDYNSMMYGENRDRRPSNAGKSRIAPTQGAKNTVPAANTQRTQAATSKETTKSVQTANANNKMNQTPSNRSGYAAALLSPGSQKPHQPAKVIGKKNEKSANPTSAPTKTDTTSATPTAGGDNAWGKGKSSFADVLKTSTGAPVTSTANPPKPQASNPPKAQSSATSKSQKSQSNRKSNQSKPQKPTETKSSTKGPADFRDFGALNEGHQGRTSFSSRKQSNRK